MPDLEPQAEEGRRRVTTYTDAQGRPTTNPSLAVTGEIVEYDAHGAPRGRTRFFLSEREMPSWLPVGEVAFLLWVLVALIVAWLIVGLALGLV